MIGGARLAAPPRAPHASAISDYRITISERTHAPAAAARASMRLYVHAGNICGNATPPCQQSSTPHTAPLSAEARLAVVAAGVAVCTAVAAVQSASHSGSSSWTVPSAPYHLHPRVNTTIDATGTGTEAQGGGGAAAAGVHRAAAAGGARCGRRVVGDAVRGGRPAGRGRHR